MAVVDKHGVDSAFALIEEQRLPVVNMPSAHVDEPRQPEIIPIPNSPQTAAGEDFIKAEIFTKESGAKAESSTGTENPSIYRPAPLVPLKE